MSEVVELRRDEDLLWVTLNDPQRANALSPTLASALTEVYERPWRSEGVRALLLAGAGKNFSAGADLD
ncbi:MAG: enoyl-CoA hydratase/isomerase family protein, partial [Thermoanaerobaculia bacterium]